MARPYVVRVDPPPELDGLLAVVTGGSGAIGRAISLRLALSGAEVHVLGRSTSRLDAVVDEIREHGGTAHVAQVDLEDDDGRDEVLRLPPDRRHPRELRGWKRTW